jgi:AraC-like DNA-binding protein
MFRDESADAALRPSIGLLASAIARHVHTAGDHETPLPALSFHRRDAPTEAIPCVYPLGAIPCVYPLGLALTAQGDKQVTVGDRILDYFPGQSLLTTIDLPVVSHVTRADTTEPYLGLLLRLDARSIALLASNMKLARPDRSRTDEPISIERLDPGLLDALRRLVNLLDEPLLLPRLAPLVEQEIIIRLLTGPHGPYLWALTMEESPHEQIATVVAWLKENFSKAIRVDALAATANMSPSTFRQHFREITGLSPVQYQKQLRLLEARQIMLHRHLDASQAAKLVGYQSVSQFSRDYNRVFGAPPRRDVRDKRSR